jgi:hypothetical protein
MFGNLFFPRCPPSMIIWFPKLNLVECYFCLVELLPSHDLCLTCICRELNNNAINGTLDINGIRHLGNTLLNGNLQILSIQFNNIINVDGYSPENITTITTVFMLQGNPYCTSNKQSNGQRCYCHQICLLLSDNSRQNIRQVIIISTTICVVILSLVIAIGGWIFWKNKQKNRYELIQIQQSKS